MTFHSRIPTACDTNEAKQSLLVCAVKDALDTGVGSDVFDIAAAIRGHSDESEGSLADGLEEHDFDGENIASALATVKEN